jgi:two-component system sensor histidine kinase MprB
MAAIAAVATISIGLASYSSTRDRLLAEVDRSLAEFDTAVAERRIGPEVLRQRTVLSGFEAQVIGADGSVAQTTFSAPIALQAEASEVVGQPRANRFTTISTADGAFRMRTVGLPRGAVQIARPLDETNRVLQGIRTRTILLVLLVSAAAAGAGLWIAGRVTASLRRLTIAAETVESTGKLDVHVREEGSDEVGRLSVAFDRMLSALARSKDEQRRLVQDAGHELRTPLTSVRTNIDTLRRFPSLSDEQRDSIVDDLHAETEELTELVNEVVAVASGESDNEPRTTFDLAEIAVELAARYERRSGQCIKVDSTSSLVSAQRSAVQRAISCLLDNATKFDASGADIEVVVAEGTVSVSDRGVGISESELVLVFERFHRADESRAMPGSGLGLSIVREMAERHGGDVFASNRPGGGATVGFRLR